MAIILAICILVGLVAFDKIKERYYPYLIYSIALTVLLQVTLVSNYLVGTDIHVEYYFAQLAASDGWNSALYHPGNSALGNVILVPFISHVIPIVWIYKILFPIMFAFVPVILYFIYKSWVDAKLAFLSAFFFISVPTYFMELSSIARQQLASLFFVSVLYFILVSDLKMWYKLPLVTILSFGVIVSHYSLGVALMFFLITGFVIKACLKHKGKFPTWALGLVALVVFIGGVWYYGSVAGGSTLRIIASVIPIRPVEIGSVIVGAPEPVVAALVGREHTPLMKVALGLDFFEVDFWGKVFRIFQFITQLSLIVGLFMFLRKKQYYVFAGASVLILAMCVLMPSFSALLNATRFYHLSLFMLAPAFVLGGMFIFRSPKTLVLCLMVPYFLFTSGLMFEITGQENLNIITTPYSIALSDHRIDLGGGFTKNDELVRDWIIANDINHIYSDHYGTLFLCQYLGFKVSPLPERGDLSEGSYIFLRERSVKNGIIVHWAGVGLRSHVEFDMNNNVVYQVGESKVVRIGE